MDRKSTIHKCTEEESEITNPQTSGVLFIVGMPRSGTKLLRALLNNHSRVALSPIETEFLPYWVQNWDKLGDRLAEFDQFQKFYNSVIKYPYFLYMRERDSLISVEKWYNSCHSFDPAGVFEALIRHDAGSSDDMIWGDKSPSYINHILLLKNLYPHAKIIHIVRDVRDYCLSIHKAWGKDMLRAAQRWNDDVQHAVHDIAFFPGDCLSVRYEDLIDDPKSIVKKICLFLDIAFENNMLSTTGEVENIGEAKGVRGILQFNKNKYKKNLTREMIKGIEELTWTTLKDFSYDVDYQGKLRRIGDFQMRLLAIKDGLNLIMSGKQNRGIIKSFLFHCKYIRISGNRN